MRYVDSARHSRQWPEIHIVAMLDLFDKGHTGEEVASIMNTRFRTVYTRSSVLGMKDRLKRDGYLG